MKIEACIDDRWVDLEYASLSEAWHGLKAQGYSVTQVAAAPVPEPKPEPKEPDGGLGPMRHSYLVSTPVPFGYPEHKKATE